MSTELSLSPKTEMIDYEELLSTYAGQLSENLSSVSSCYIKTQGKLFTMPNGISGATIECIVLDFIRMNRLMPPFNPQIPQSPLCWALGRRENELAPICEKRISDTCATCPKNAFGSAPGGGKGKACSNSYRLAVCTPTGGDIWFLNVSPTALKRFNSFVAACRTIHPLGMIGLITKIGFIHTMAQPSLTFETVKPHELPSAALANLITAANIDIMKSPAED